MIDDGPLVNTGQSGILVFSGVISEFDPVNATNGSPAYDCVTYSDGTYLWGAAQQADVKLGGDTAAKLPIHVISTSGTNQQPASFECYDPHDGMRWFCDDCRPDIAERDAPRWNSGPPMPVPSTASAWATPAAHFIQTWLLA